MIVFSIRSTEHLVNQMTLPIGARTIKTFSDGELFVRIDTDVHNQEVWVVAATCQPDNNFFELFFLLDALERNGARINLLITYFGYARQDRAQPGEAVGAEVVSTFLKTFAINKLFIVHEHSTRLHEYLTFTSIIPIEPLCDIAKEYDAIVAPDTGAYNLAKRIADICALETVAITKMRPAHEEVKVIETLGDVYAKNLLIIDDIIATGSTLKAASTILKEQGAQRIAVYGTHGIFSNHAREHLQNTSAIDVIYTTNTIQQPAPSSEFSKIVIINIAFFLEKIIRENSDEEEVV